jgi:COMPASS component SWD3
VRNKEVIQKVSGHEGVVCWVDTSSAKPGTIVSGGLDGTVRIWVDVNEDEDGVGDMNGLKLEQGDGIDDVMRDDVAGNGAGFEDTPRETSVDVERSPEQDVENAHARSSDKMDED